MSAATAPLIVMPASDLAALVRSAVAEGIAELRVQLPAPPRAGPAYLTLSEMAELARCSTRSIRRLIATGRLRALRRTLSGSSRVLIARVDAERFIASGGHHDPR